MKDFPFPGDSFTNKHFQALQKINGNKAERVGDAIKKLLDQRYIQTEEHYRQDHPNENNEPWKGIATVPVVYPEPIVLEQSLIDYRLQFAADIGSRDIAASASRGRFFWQ